MCTADGSAPLYAQSVPLVNIVGPNVQTDPFDRNFNDPSRNNASFLLAPGERGVITLRAYCADGAANCTRELIASLRGKVALGVVAQGANCFAEDNGLGDAVGGLNRCVVDNGPPKDIYDPIPPMISVLNPTITTPETIVQAIDVDNTGFEAVAFSLSATDNVAVASVSCLAGTTTVSPTGVSGDAYQFTGTFPVGATAVTCTALDVRGTPAPNSASVGFVVNVRDVTPPSFDVSADPGSPFLPSNPAEATSAAGAQVFYSSPAATDSNGGLVTVTCGSGSLVSGSTFPIGTTDINCVATDDSGVSTAPTNLFDITVADRAAPSITIDGAPTAAVEGNVLGGAAVTFTASASDAVSGTLLASCSVASGSVFAVGITTVTCTATDAASNTGSSSFAVTVVDTIAPVVTLNGAAAITIEAGSTYADPGATAMDVVAGARTVAVSGSVNLLSVGIYTLTYVASDPSGNTASAVRTVTVADRTAPVFGSLANVTAEATSAAGATVTYTSPSATDIADASLTISCVKASGSAFALGISTVNCTATDDSGNVGNGSFTVTVLDRLAPAFGAVVNVIAEATSPAGAAVTYTAPSATDAVGATVSCLPAAGSTFALGTSLVRCTATDAALNSAATTLTVTVRDTVAPALTVPANITTTATSAAGAVVNYTAPSATDIVDTSVTLACPSSPTAGKTSGSTFPIGTTTVNCTATDDYSNVTSKSFTVTVNNPPLPVVTATANPSTLLWSPNKTMTPVTVSGVITTSILQSASYRVVDEYGKVQPAGTITVGTGGSYSFVVRLEAFRNGTDTNGRVYTITVTATDTINRTATAQAIVLVPHSQQ